MRCVEFFARRKDNFQKGSGMTSCELWNVFHGISGRVCYLTALQGTFWRDLALRVLSVGGGVPRSLLVPLTGDL